MVTSARRSAWLTDSRRFFYLMTIAFTLWIAAPWYVLFVVHAGRHHWISSVSASAGLSIYALLALQLTLSTRSRVLDSAIGLSSAMSIHRITGPLIITLIPGHAIVSFFVYSPFTRSVRVMVPDLIPTVPAIFSVVCIVVAVITGVLRTSARFSARMWRKLHAIGYCALPAAMIHGLTSGRMTTHSPALLFHALASTLLPLGFLAERLYRQWSSLRNAARVVYVRRDQNAGLVRLCVEPRTLIDFTPGQFCFLRVPGNDAHPFTIASSQRSRTLVFIARISGTFTLDLARLKENDPIAIEGPYGRFSPTHGNATRTDRRVWLAGGIGITPFISAACAPNAGSTTLIWYRHLADGIVLRSDLARAVRTNPGMCITHVVSRAFLHRATPVDSNAFDTMQIVPGTIIPGNRPLPTLVSMTLRSAFLCGPSELIARWKMELKQMGVSGRQIHEERFIL